MANPLLKRAMMGSSSTVGGGGGGLPPRGPFLPPAGSSSGGGRGPRRRDYSAVHWSKYFRNKRFVDVETGGGDRPSKIKFCVYEAGSGDPSKPVLVFLHGGGFSGLTFALLAKHLEGAVDCRILAPDLRGHGETLVAPIGSDEGDLSADTMARDICQLVNAAVSTGGHAVHGDGDEAGGAFSGRLSPEVDAGDDRARHRPPVVLLGHSMGGALAVHSALRREIDNLAALCVIDVVEGTALAALSSMQGFLRSRPQNFKSLEQAVEWAVRSGQLHNSQSARVSMPGQLRNCATGTCASAEVRPTDGAAATATAPSHPGGAGNFVRPSSGIPGGCEAIVEEGDEAGGPSGNRQEDRPATAEQSPAYAWRTDLASTEPHWTGWFTGLSSKFLETPVSKLLVLAGVDRLDKDLTVGQMQGKFQMQVLPQAGHAVHEDVPDKVGDLLASFLVRNKIAEPLDNFVRTFPAC